MLCSFISSQVLSPINTEFICRVAMRWAVVQALTDCKRLGGRVVVMMMAMMVTGNNGSGSSKSKPSRHPSLVTQRHSHTVTVRLTANDHKTWHTLFPTIQPSIHPTEHSVHLRSAVLSCICTAGHRTVLVLTSRQTADCCNFRYNKEGKERKKDKKYDKRSQPQMRRTIRRECVSCRCCCSRFPLVSCCWAIYWYRQ